MANLLYANNAAGTLASGITNVQTTLTLNPGAAALFPAPTGGQAFYATITDAATQTLIEIVQVTAVAGNVFSIVRGQDGTSGLSWNANDIVSQRAIRLEMQGWENAAEGIFTGVQITPSTTNGIKGTTAGDSANAGVVGEFQTTSGGNGAMPNNSSTVIATLGLTPGDWDVEATVSALSAGGATFGNVICGLSNTAGFQGLGTYWQLASTQVANATLVFPTPTVRFNSAGVQSISLICQVSFSGGGAVAVTCVIRARRVR